MDILIVAHLFPRASDPSKGVFVLRQAEALVARGHSVTVISPVAYVPPLVAELLDRSSSAVLPETDTFDGITVHYPRYYSLPRPETLPLVAYSYRRTIRTFREQFLSADIVNAHVAVPDGFATAPIAEEADVPLVTTIHGADLQISIHRPFVEPQIRRAVTVSSAIIQNSYKTKRLFENHFGTDHRTEVIHNGIPVKEVKNALSSEESRSIFRIVSVGNLDETKGHRFALEAISRLSTEIEYVIVGDGPKRTELERQATKLGIRNDVVFMGAVPHEEVFTYLVSADVFVLPSYVEAFGIVYLEAMACGLPAIACEGEGPADYISDRKTGFLVPPQDPNAINDVLRELIDDPELRESIATRGQRVALNAFSWERNAASVERVFQQVLSDPN